MQFKRVLLKLSGESFADESGQGLNQERLLSLSKQIQAAVTAGVQVAIVVGGGNFLRGATLSNDVISRTTADHMGMMATILNALALSDALNTINQETAIFSAVAVQGIADAFDYRRAISRMNRGEVVICAGGTGNPFVTTDSAASLRAVELGANVLLKGTKVNGVYDKDPNRFNDAKRYDHLSFKKVLQDELRVMDLAAFCQCRDYNVPIRVFNVFEPNALLNVLKGAQEGTLVTNEE